MKVGIIDVGGGNRGSFGAGVFDYCIEHQIEFPYVIGVSAGSANGVSYLSKQRGRNKQFYLEYSMRSEYMGIKNWIRKGVFLDLDYIYSTLSNSDGENPVDYDAFQNNPAKLVVVSTNAETGKAEYFDKSDFAQDNYDVLKASCCIPVICKPYFLKGKKYYDGGLSDPIPFQKAFADGCDKVIIILTRPKNEFRTSKGDLKTARLLERKNPQVANLIRNRCSLYNVQLKEALQLEKENRVLILAPDTIDGLSTLDKDPVKLEALYQKGVVEAEKIHSFLVSCQ